MKMMRRVGISVIMIVISASLARGQDLSKYRNFSLGMSLPELSNQVDLRPLQTKLIQKHPAVVQELACWPGGSSDHSRQADSVWQIFFSFYNGELYELYRSTEKIIARWEDSQYSINLVRSRFLNSFALAMFSKRLDGEAEAAIAEAVELERQKAPQTEVARMKKEADNLEAARQKNRKMFRP